jgi:hypothetical protein
MTGHRLEDCAEVQSARLVQRRILAAVAEAATGQVPSRRHARHARHQPYVVNAPRSGQEDHC